MPHPVLLIRHAVGVHNLADDDDCDEVDVYDAELTRAGRREAKQHAADILKLIHTRAKREVIVLCSPLRRCLQTCKCMLQYADPTVAFFQPRVSRLLIESSSYECCAGHFVSYLKQHFGGFDWSDMEQAPAVWWSTKYRLDRTRPVRALNELFSYSELYPVVAFTHGDLIERMTGHSLHNCEAVVTFDKGRHWARYDIGKSPSRLRANRPKLC